MKKILRTIWNGISRLGTQFNHDTSKDIRNFEEMEPLKYTKSLEYSLIYEDNRQSIDFLKKEASAFWKLNSYISRRNIQEDFLDQVFEVANLNPDQNWRTSYDRGEIHWQTALSSFEEPAFLYRIKIMEERLLRRKKRSA